LNEDKEEAKNEIKSSKYFQQSLYIPEEMYFFVDFFLSARNKPSIRAEL
jgi:hypothetical protein